MLYLGQQATTKGYDLSPKLFSSPCGTSAVEEQQNRRQVDEERIPQALGACLICFLTHQDHSVLGLVSSCTRHLVCC